jgi:hypothetical protein
MEGELLADDFFLMLVMPERPADSFAFESCLFSPPKFEILCMAATAIYNYSTQDTYCALCNNGIVLPVAREPAKNWPEQP